MQNTNKIIKTTIANIEDGKQLIRSSGAVGANYIEANEKLGKKDFVFRLKIARKEDKESRYWLRLIQSNNLNSEKISELIRESDEQKKSYQQLSIKYRL